MDQMNPRYLGIFATIVLVVAAACGPGGATTRPATPAPGSPAAGTPVAGTPVAATPTAGAPASPEATPGVPNPHEDGADLGERVIPAGEDLHIVMWGVLSGPDSALGIDVQRGVEIAVQDRPEVAGFTVELTSEDGLCSPEGGSTAASRIAADVTVVGLIGSVCSDETVGGIELITNAGLTTISPSNTRPTLTDPARADSYDGYLRTAHNDLFQGAKAAEFAYNVLESRRAATIHDNSSYAQALQQVFADEFTKLGGEITIQTVLTDQNATSVLETVAPTTPDLIYYPVFTAPFGYITAAVRDVPGLEEVDLMGADAGFSAAAIEAGGNNALNMYLSSPDTRQFPGDYEDFLAKHLAEYNEDPLQIFHAHAYDATNMLFDAIELVAVANDDGSLTIPLGPLRDAIYATADYPGITGSLTCGDFGDCGAPAIGVYQITQANIDGTWPPAPIWPEL